MVDLPSTVVNGMTPERERLLEKLQTKKYDSITALCEDAGVTRNVYYDALQNKEFVAELFKNGKAIIFTAVPAITKKMVEQAMEGSYPQQRMLLEMIQFYEEQKAGTTVNNNTFNLSAEAMNPANLERAAYWFIEKKYGLNQEQLESLINKE